MRNVGDVRLTIDAFQTANAGVNMNDRDDGLRTIPTVILTTVDEPGA